MSQEHSKKYKSFCITVRPRGGLHGEYDEAVVKYIRKQLYYVYNYEKEAEARHIHAQIFFDEPVRKSNVQTALKRIAEKHDKDWSPSSRKVLVSGVKIAYNDNFMDNYITKDGDINLENYKPPDATQDYYPSEEEQAQAIAQAGAVDQKFHRLKQLWELEHEEYIEHQKTLKDVGHFIYKLMFEDKLIDVIADDRRRKQLVKALTHYIFPYNSSVMNYMFTQEDQQIFSNIPDPI